MWFDLTLNKANKKKYVQRKSIKYRKHVLINDYFCEKLRMRRYVKKLHHKFDNFALTKEIDIFDGESFANPVQKKRKIKIAPYQVSELIQQAVFHFPSCSKANKIEITHV